MSRRLSVTLPDEVISMIEARARDSGKSKSEDRLSPDPDE